MTVSNIELAMKGREKIRAFVDMRLFLDVENIEYFSSLDWENILWERTFPELQRGLDGKAKNYKKRFKNNKDYIIKYNILGFLYPFQVISSNKQVCLLYF